MQKRASSGCAWTALATLLLTGMGAFLLAPAAQGQGGATWTGMFSGNWSGYNWTQLSPPNGSGATAIFDPSNLAGAGASTITLDVPITLGNLTFENAGAAPNANFTLGGDTLTFDTDDLEPIFLNVDSTYNGTVEIDANITVAEVANMTIHNPTPLSIDNNGTGFRVTSLILGVNGNPGSQLDLVFDSISVSGTSNTTIAKDIVGSGGLIETPLTHLLTPGVLTLTGTSTYTGNTTVDGGTLVVIGSGAAIQDTNQVVVGNGTVVPGNLMIADGGEVTSGEGIVGDAGGNGTVIVGGANSTWNLGSSDLVLGYYGPGILTISDNGTVAAGSLKLAQESGSVGVVNLESNGTLAVGGTNGIAAGGGSATFNWGGGVIEVTGSDLTTSVAMTLVSNTTSTINTNGLNATWSGGLSGNGSLDKIGVGTFTLNGTNTYAGGTDVSAGTLVITSFSSAGAGNVSIADGANLTLETNAALASTTSLILVDGAQVELDFSGTDTISMFYLDGSAQALGTWGGTGSGAQYIDPVLFSGSGVLEVTSVPEPAAFGFILGGLALMAARGSIAGRKLLRKLG